MGKVVKIYTDGDLRVQLDGHAWTLHPHCVRLIPGSATELANTMHALQNQRQEPSSKSGNILTSIDLRSVYNYILSNNYVNKFLNDYYNNN